MPSRSTVHAQLRQRHANAYDDFSRSPILEVFLRLETTWSGRRFGRNCSSQRAAGLISAFVTIREVLESFRYQYDARGNSAEEVVAAGSAERYGWDDLSRLTSATYGTRRSVDYDPVGNRLEVSAVVNAMAIAPLVAAGQIVLGMTSPEVQVILGRPSAAYPFRAGRCECYSGRGILVRYSTAGRCVAIELSLPANPVLSRHHLLGASLCEVAALLHEIDPNLELLESGDDAAVISRAVGISAWGDSGGWRSRAETVVVSLGESRDE